MPKYFAGNQLYFDKCRISNTVMEIFNGEKDEENWLPTYEHCPHWRHSVGHTGLVIMVTSYWARWRLKSLALPLFTQPFIQGQIKRKHQSSGSQAFVRGIHRWPVNSPHKWPVTRKMFPFDDVIMSWRNTGLIYIRSSATSHYLSTKLSDAI